jgi:hypothetical protein
MNHMLFVFASDQESIETGHKSGCEGALKEPTLRWMTRFVPLIGHS